MPTYDYICTKCNAEQEEIHSMHGVTNDENDASRNITCKSCGAVGEMKRRVGSPMIATYDMATPEQKREMLKKRSHDHFKKNIEEKFHVMNKKTL